MLALAVAATSVTSFVLLDRATDCAPWLKYAVATVGLAAALMLLGVRHLPARVGTAVAGVALLASLAGPAAYSLATAATPHTGSIPSAGPTVAGSFGPGGGGGGAPGGRPAGAPDGTTGTAPTAPPGQATDGQAGQTGQAGGGAGGLLEGSTPGAEITSLLEADADSYTWVAAAVGSNTASGYQLATEQPVMAIGGFNGSDPSPTLEQFQEWVAAGDIHYFIAGGQDDGGAGGGGPGGGGPGGGPGGQDGGSSSASEISTWVTENYAAQTVDGITVYDLTEGVSA